MNHTNSLCLPEKIEKEYRLTSLLSLHENSIVFSMERKKKQSKMTTEKSNYDNDNVLKVVPKSYFDQALFDTLRGLHCQSLLLPSELFAEQDFIFAVYPKMLSFTEYLLEKSVSFSIILQLMEDLCNTVSLLHERGIFHGDIAPANMYLDKEGHFYLGDFSSARLLHKRNPLLLREKRKTESTFPFPLGNKDFRQDIFSFLTMLSHLLDAIATHIEQEVSDFSALQYCVEELLLEIMSDKDFSLTFYQVCRKILSLITEKGLDKSLSQNSFCLSHNELNFIYKTTRCRKKNSISHLPVGMPNISVPTIGLLCCLLLFVVSIIFYTRTDRAANNTVYSSETVVSSPFSDTMPPSSKLPSTDTPSSDNILPENSPPPTNNTLPENTPPLSDNLLPENTLLPSNNTLPENTPPPSDNTLPGSAPPQRKDNPSANPVINISCKKYQNIPKNIPENSSVKIIFAQENRFEKLSSFSGYHSLEELYLDNNNINNLEDISDLKALKILGLSNNKITNVSHLAELSSLTILDLSCQKKLSNIFSLKKLSELKYLVLTGTNISKKEIQRLQKALPQCTILY